MGGGEGGGGCIFIYSYIHAHTVKTIAFKINRRAEHEYMNMHPPPLNYRSSYGPALIQ